MRKLFKGCVRIFLVIIFIGIVLSVFRGLGNRGGTSLPTLAILPSQTPHIIIVTATSGIAEARPSGLVTMIFTSTMTPEPEVIAAAVTAAPSATITETPRPTSTTEPTVTPLPVTLPPPQPTVNAIAETTYYATGQANLRSCPETSCDRVGTVQIGTNLTVTGIAQGESVSTGNPVWYRVVYGSGTAYVYSSLVTNVRPAPAQPAPAQQAPAQSQPAAPVEPRASSGNTRRPANCAEAVSMGLSDVEAAQWSHLDRDKDGVACYGD